MIQFSAPGKYVPPNRREGQDCVFHLANGGWEWLFDWDHVKRSGYQQSIFFLAVVLSIALLVICPNSN